MPDAVAFSARAQRRQHRDSYTEWIQVALLVVMAGLAVYTLITR